MKHVRRNILIYIVVLMMAAAGITGCGRDNDAVITEGPDTLAKPGSSTQEEEPGGSEAGTGAGQDTAAAVTATGSSADKTLTITALKGGAADAFVLMTDDHVTLIDTGLDKKADKLVDFLHEQGVTRIDEIIITHFDKDHVGGADHILAEFEVGSVYTTYRSKDSDDITSYTQALITAGLTETVVKEITTLQAGGVTFTIYPPQALVYADDVSNNSSLVIKVSVGENSMLFAGDAEFERIRELLATPGLESVILKVPHHGRIAANSREFIEYISPEYAIITSSNSEPEDQEVLDILDSLGVATYLTKNGNVTVTMTASEVSVTQ